MRVACIVAALVLLPLIVACRGAVSSQNIRRATALGVSSSSSGGPPPGSGSSSGGSSSGSSSSSSSSGGSSSSSGSSSSGAPGWLHTNTNHIYNEGGTQWMGRGVTLDDILFCGYDAGVWLGSAAATTAEAIIDEAVTQWSANFIRISLSMNSYSGSTISWSANTDQYATLMTSVIDYMGSTYPGVYLLLTLRSDSSMDCPGGGVCSGSCGEEYACVPTASTAPVYKALVDAFANQSFVIFALSNEPGASSGPALISAMNSGVAAIRDEEAALGTPPHLIAVQGLGGGDLSVYSTTSIQPAGNIVYEFHYYPFLAGSVPSDYNSYKDTLPMIVGEYGDFTSSGATSQASFYKDMEALQIPNLAWDFDPLNDCAPDLVEVNTSESPTPATPSAGWGTTVQPYLLNPGSFK